MPSYIYCCNGLIKFFFIEIPIQIIVLNAIYMRTKSFLRKNKAWLHYIGCNGCMLVDFLRVWIFWQAFTEELDIHTRINTNVKKQTHSLLAIVILIGHTKTGMKVVFLDKVKSSDLEYIKERECHLIRRFNSFYIGLNRNPKLASSGISVTSLRCLSLKFIQI